MRVKLRGVEGITPNCKRYVINFSTRSSIPHRNVNVRAARKRYPWYRLDHHARHIRGGEKLEMGLFALVDSK
jgi:hypothetical protein